MNTRNYFDPPRPLRDYGFDVNHRPIVQAGSLSGYLLPWDALDAEAAAVSGRNPCQFVIIGETVRVDGVRFPELGVNAAWMRDQGYVRTKRTDWHHESIECEKQKHEHIAQPVVRVAR